MDIVKYGSWKKALIPWIFLCLPLALYGLFVLFPWVQTLVLGASDWDGLSPNWNWVGLENYGRAVRDKIAIAAFGNNIYWAILGTFLPIAVSLPLAELVINIRKVNLQNIFRFFFFLPMILPSVVVAIIWGWIYNPYFGLLNRFLAFLHLDSLSHAWLGERTTALPSLIVASAWAYYGFCFIIFLTARQGISDEYYESAKIDGASFLCQFFSISLPLLKRPFIFISSYTIIGGFSRVFDIVWITTEGGPANATEVLGTYIYKLGFKFQQSGYASAISLILSLLVMIIFILFHFLTNKKDRE